MGNWRRQNGKRSDYYHQEMTQKQQGSRSYNRKPPLANWKQSVPAWEKDFCTLVGSIPWWKVLEAKKFMYQFENVVKWNDSAGEEAFKDAKSRFWAKINGLPCDISLPDPDVYIDNVDWDADVDTELLLDLERDPEAGDDVDKDGNVVILDMSIVMSQYVGVGWGTGWGEVDENPQGNNENRDWNTGNEEKAWEQDPYVKKLSTQDDEWKDGWIDDTWQGGSTCEASHDENWGNARKEPTQYNGWEKSPSDYQAGNTGKDCNLQGKNVDRRNGGDWNWKKRGGHRGYTRRNNSSRFRGDDQNMVGYGWRNDRGRIRGNLHSGNRLWMESY